MDRDELRARVQATLQALANPRTGADFWSGGHIRELETDGDGLVRFQFVLGQEDPGTLVREARAAIEALAGVSRVKIDVKLPNAPTASRGSGGAPPAGRPLRPGSVPAATPDTNLSASIGRIIAVSSGKGGVGKSTVAANLAVSLVTAGHRVGLLDADVYGPDIPLMFGERRRPRVSGERGAEKIVPLEAHGVQLMSIGFLLEDEQPAIMRGPLVSGILRQFLEQVEWDHLDYLIVDMPPGTGDAQLSLTQIVNVDGAVLVTTPQEVSTGDVRRAVKMFEKVRTPVLGIVENMSGLVCPHCQEMVDVFGSGGGERLAREMELPFLGAIPLDPRVRESGDTGRPLIVALPDSPAGQAFRAVASKVVEAVQPTRT